MQDNLGRYLQDKEDQWTYAGHITELGSLSGPAGS
jgi:hypothetical protein